MHEEILITKSSKQYELLDSGEGTKLERFGAIFLVRPDPQALWKKALPEKEWAKADGRFASDAEEKTGSWKMAPAIPKEWRIELGGLHFFVRPASFKHVGVFPEHLSHWKWMQHVVAGVSKPSVLNLFGYTGGATLALAKAGAEVCHVDASKAAITAAKNNAEASGLKDAPIRWIVDDAISFAKREIKRGRKYDAIIMDPPSFGRGPKGEVWKLEERFNELLELAKALLSEKPLFVLLNGYAAGYSHIAYANGLKGVFGKKGMITSGELAIEDRSGRLLPAGIFARLSFVLEKP